MFDERRTRTLLGPADPARGVVVPPPRVGATDLIRRGDPARLVTPARPGRRAVLAAAAVTVAAGATAGAYPFLRSTKEVSRPPVRTDAGLVIPIAYQIPTDPPPAGRYLRELVRRIGNAPYDVHSGRYTYHHTKWWGGMRVVSPEGHVQIFVDERKVWAAPDGSGRRRHRMLPPEYPDEASRRHFESLAAPSSDETTPPPEGPHAEISPGVVGPTEPLPTNRGPLARLLDVQYGPGAAAKKLGTIYDEYGIPRATRALILNILAAMPGWFWRGEVTDRAGRAGVAITGEDHGQQVVLVFDPKTGVLLAHESVFLKPKRQVGAYQLLLAMDRTDRLG